MKNKAMSKVKSKDGNAERIMGSILKSSGISFKKNVRGMPGTPDFVLTKEKIVIFIDGCFWHGCPKCHKTPKSNVDFWKNKFSVNFLRDKKNNCDLTMAGWYVIRFWEHELIGKDKNHDDILMRVKHARSMHRKLTGKEGK